jgi:hypothetical protein
MQEDHQPETPRKLRRMRGFEATSGLVKDRIRQASESRGFALPRLLTHWAEVVGEAEARITRPVKIAHAKGAMGATLTLLVSGVNAPLVEMGKERIRQRVNAVYGYNAISRILLTQTAPVGFAEGQAAFAPAPKAPVTPDPAIRAEAARLAQDVHDETLRAALEGLAQNIFTRRRKTRG